MCPNYEYRCPDCQHEQVENVRMDDRDTKNIACEQCAASTTRVISAPTLMVAAYPDGVKRPGWADVLATAKLAEAKAKADWRSDDATQINKELDERERKAKK